MEGVAAGVEELQDDPSVGLVDLAGDQLVGAQGAGVGLGAARGEAAAAVGGEAAGDDQPHAAAGALAEIGGELLRVRRVVLESRVHRPHDDPVADLEGAEVERGEQGSVPRRCGGVLRRRHARDSASSPAYAGTDRSHTAARSPR